MKFSNLKKSYANLTAILSNSVDFVAFAPHLTERMFTTK